MWYTAHMAEAIDLPHTAEVASVSEIGKVRREVAAAASEALGNDVGADVALVVSELITNALEHGDDGVVAVDYGSTGDGFVLTVASPSSGLPIERERPVPDTDTRGRGLRIVSAISDVVNVTQANGSVIVRCRFGPR